MRFVFYNRFNKAFVISVYDGGSSIITGLLKPYSCHEVEFEAVTDTFQLEGTFVDNNKDEFQNTVPMVQESEEYVSKDSDHKLRSKRTWKDYDIVGLQLAYKTQFTIDSSSEVICFTLRKENKQLLGGMYVLLPVDADFKFVKGITFVRKKDVTPDMLHRALISTIRNMAIPLIICVLIFLLGICLWFIIQYYLDNISVYSYLRGIERLPFMMVIGGATGLLLIILNIALSYRIFRKTEYLYI